MAKPVVVLVGTGFIGQAIARRTGAGKKVLLAGVAVAKDGRAT